MRGVDFWVADLDPLCCAGLEDVGSWAAYYCGEKDISKAQAVIEAFLPKVVPEQRQKLLELAVAVPFWAFAEARRKVLESEEGEQALDSIVWAQDCFGGSSTALCGGGLSKLRCVCCVLPISSLDLCSA